MPWIEALTALAQEPAVNETMMKTAPGWHREISHTGSAVLRSMKRELLDFCRQVSAVDPLILVIDDFQWSDAASADLLAFLAARLEHSHVLVVVCYRRVEMQIKSHPFLRVRAELLSRGPCTEIELAPLSRAHIGLMATDDADRLYAKSDGNPLFFRELVRCEEGRLSQMIQAGIDRLDDTHRQLLVTASVQGREFDSAVLAATVQLASQDVEESLQELDETYGLIQRIREQQLPDGRFTVRYRFVYALYHEACYASLAPTRKASLSASLAEAFLTYYGN
jgi:predicted ATPase